LEIYAQDNPLLRNHRPHRVFAAVYALFAFAIVRFGFEAAAGEALFIALVSFLGYSLHLLMDRGYDLFR